jgi:hypothetical protein
LSHRLKNLGSASILEIELVVFWSLMTMLPTDMTCLQVCAFKCSTLIFRLGILLSTSAQGNHRLTTNGMLLTVMLDRLIVSYIYIYIYIYNVFIYYTWVHSIYRMHPGRTYAPGAPGPSQTAPPRSNRRFVFVPPARSRQNLFTSDSSLQLEDTPSCNQQATNIATGATTETQVCN